LTAEISSNDILFKIKDSDLYLTLEQETKFKEADKLITGIKNTQTNIENLSA